MFRNWKWFTQNLVMGIHLHERKDFKRLSTFFNLCKVEISVIKWISTLLFATPYELFIKNIHVKYFLRYKQITANNEIKIIIRFEL